MGYLRFFLAITVSISHLWLNTFNGGSVAVVGFFCLSGFWITKIINEIYGATARGKAHFILNRVIRIYPTYYLCLCIGILCFIIVPDAHKFNATMVLPKAWHGWLVQLSVFGLDNDILHVARTNIIYHAILAQGWSLNIELVYYLWMGLIIGTSFGMTLAWCIISFGISAYLLWNHYAFQYHYFTVYGTSIYFATGAMLYHLLPYMKRIPKLPAMLAVLLGGSLAYIPYWLGFAVHNHPQYWYMTLPVYLYVIFCLDKAKPAGQWEQLAADVSYPIFLLHWSVAALFIHRLAVITFPFWAAATSLSLLFSLLIVKITSVFLPVRKKIRSGLKHDS